MENFNQLKNNVDSKEGQEKVDTSKEKEIVPEIFKEIKDDIEKGECGYLINTKTNVGELFRGHKRDKSEDFRTIIEASAKDLTDKLKRWEHGDVALSAKVSIMHWDKFGNAALLLSSEEIQEELRGRIKEELCRLSIEYQNDVSKFSDHRVGSTAISFLIKRKLAEDILNKIKEKPNDLLNFITYLEPELLRVAPISKKSGYSGAEGIAIFKENKTGNIDKYRAEPIEILQWGNEEESKKNINEEHNIENKKDIKPKEKREEMSKEYKDVLSQVDKELSSKKIEEVVVKNLKENEDKEKVERKIEDIKKEIEKTRLENKNEEEEKKQFIEERLQGVLDGALIVGEVPYSFPRGLYEIEKKGFLKKKYIVTSYGKAEKEFVTFEDADAFIKQKKENKAKEDLGKVWEILNGKRKSFYE